MVLVRRLVRADVVRTGVLAPLPPFVAAALLWWSDRQQAAGVLYGVALLSALAVAVFWARRSAGRGFVVVHLRARPSWLDDPDDEEAAAALDALDDLAHRLVLTVVGGGSGHFDGEHVTPTGVDLYFVGRDLGRVARELRQALRSEGVEAPVTVA